ncbi:MAG TPA: tRNA (guanine(10)-N(2))-dimethyltransferase [Methanotrichaceae archaeon]|nr:MAG: tRNA (guanine(26)-N(2))-dimethyltransferase [Methanosaeta sp. PtaU1.Bin028]HOT07326.1 tRNA (guanine(10)-N(2))-dimethyltransferase [Methanotrichaceae archaeon]HQF17314.1 tRNA (guanine(10)-N(2))-dimethyltransferase [Methanotrichaceae archaeon]HQI91940.1 tRNA (guanine(10)-N(2))-dimethyltransferase [Methanotrichaceae archaeon]HQJ29265.1 tRNA (guanine(10)-N(2))-dimethyltransferase [Methanotrichaceae archaeon]
MIQEGQVTVEAGGVFYNPRMKLNRDICVAVVRHLGLDEYCDALSASGLRGLRVAREAGTAQVVLNDVSPTAYQRMLENIARNGLANCEATQCNANVLFHQRHFQAVDLDPFGSPSPFLPAAARSALSYLFMTATDTAPLCGAHQSSGIRKYMALPVKTDYHREMGARVLLGSAVRELARVDKGAEVLLTHVTDHYVRTYLRALPGARAADKSLLEMGYIHHCRSCRGWTASPRCRDPGCPTCGGSTIPAGPLWLGKLHDRDTLQGALCGLDPDSRAAKILRSCQDELSLPMYYDHHSICQDLRIAPGRIEDVVASLHDCGFSASRTHFSGLGIKTDARADQLCAILLDLARRGRSK